MIRKHVFICGRVQGVYFRGNTMAMANKLSLRGWVRNLPDGRVEAVVEGDERAVEEMLKWCRTGTPPARVDKVTVIDEDFLGDFDNFSILG
ncbi:MAG: acylphosphatase [Bacillota bacterium]